jgi:hypothetical protein
VIGTALWALYFTVGPTERDHLRLAVFIAAEKPNGLLKGFDRVHVFSMD